MNRKLISSAILALFTAATVVTPAAIAGNGNGNNGNGNGNGGNPAALGDPRFAETNEPACNSLTLASTGGPTLKDKKTLLIRWFGYTNYELVYGDKVILLDNGYYNRAGTQYKDYGFDPATVTKADLILIGHGHADHMSDSAQVGAQTHAPIVGAPITITKLLTQPVNPAQLISVTGTTGQVLNFPNIGVTVQTILGRHGEPPAFTGAFSAAYKAAAPAPTPSEAAAFAALGARGTTDPNLTAQGTIAYVITFDDGFKVAYRDSGGKMTDFEHAAMAQIGRVDVLLGAVAANVIAESQAMILLPMLETYRPAVYIPGHHEEEIGGKTDRATEPLFQYAKNEFPDLMTISKTFREPTCFNTRFNLSQGNVDMTGPSGTPASSANLLEWNKPGLF